MKFTLGQILGLIGTAFGFIVIHIYSNILTPELYHTIDKEMADVYLWLAMAQSEIYQVNPYDIQQAKLYLASLEVTRIEIGYETYIMLAIIFIGFIGWIIPWFKVRKIVTFPIGLFLHFNDYFVNPWQREIALRNVIPQASEDIHLFFTLSIIYQALFTMGWIFDWRGFALPEKEIKEIGCVR